MPVFQRRRPLIRLLSFFLAALSVLGIVTLTTLHSRAYYQEAHAAGRLRTMLQLGEHTAALFPVLQKAAAVTQPTLFSEQLAAALENSSCAQQSLDALPGDGASYRPIYRFFRQTGDFVLYLQKKLSSGAEITAGERSTLLTLATWAQTLSQQLDTLTGDLLNERITPERAGEKLNDIQREALLTAELQTVPERFTDFPVLVYDGPFSTEQTEKENRFLAQKEELPRSEAADRAAALLGIEPVYLRYEGEDEAPIPCFRFYYQNQYVSISKQGGYPITLLSAAFAGESLFTPEDAIEKAKTCLEEQRFSQMEAGYYHIADGVCVIQFLSRQDDARCYADQIKVSVSLTGGTIVGLDSSAYLQNHHTRELPAVQITQQQAQDGLQKDMAVTYRGMAVIPKNKKELLCYEFLCTREQETYLLYIDCTTGKQADILLLLQSDNGTLTK